MFFYAFPLYLYSPNYVYGIAPSNSIPAFLSVCFFVAGGVACFLVTAGVGALV